MRNPILLFAALTTAWAADSSSFQVVSAANSTIGVAPDSLATVYGSNIASLTVSATLPWPTMLADISSVLITDSASNQQNARLTYVSPTPMNVSLPSGPPPSLSPLPFPL